MSKRRRDEGAKRKSTGRGSVQAAVEVPGATQSAAEPRAAEAQARELIAKFAPEQVRLVDAMRKALRKRLPTANELVYEYRSWFVISYSPSMQGFEGVLAIRGDADGVKLYFGQGKNLPDPEKLLKGSAQVRFIDVDGASTLTRPAVVSLIEAAIAHHRVPFAPAGRGSLVIRSASAKQSSKSAKTRRRPA